MESNNQVHDAGLAAGVGNSFGFNHPGNELAVLDFGPVGAESLAIYTIVKRDGQQVTICSLIVPVDEIDWDRLVPERRRSLVRRPIECL